MPLRKALSTVALALLSLSGTAQVKVGDVAPDFNLSDVNGIPQHLYSILDSGYTVILDMGAAWCGPCWDAHESHVFDSLTTHYGKNGTISPGKVKVLFVECEYRNTTAQLYGINGTGNATNTMGNWVAGTNYPIIDNNSLNPSYTYIGIPSFTVICRDRFVMHTGAGFDPAVQTAESYWMDIINRQCPAYAPSATVDAKAVLYNGPTSFICSGTPPIRFQNYSTTSNITAATINIYSGPALMATYGWTGSLAPYGVATVQMPSFAGNGLPYKSEVIVAGDTRPSNNTSADSIFKVYTPQNAPPMPALQNFEQQANNTLPYRMAKSLDDNIFLLKDIGPFPLVDRGGNPSRALQFHLSFMTQNASTTLTVGNFNTAAASDVYFDFDYAYRQKLAADNDKLDIQVSGDCGATWSSVWTKAGTALATLYPDSVGYSVIPHADSVWKHGSVNLAAYKNQNMVIRIVATSNPSRELWGRDIWMDNFRLSNTTGVVAVVGGNGLSIYPNPAGQQAGQQAVLDFNLLQGAEVSVSVVDVTGRLVSAVPAQ